MRTGGGVEKMADMSSAAAVRVLIVEDERAVAHLLCRYVTRRAGHEIIGVAETASQAQRLIAQGRPDLVLLDLGLSGVNGLDILREIRQSGGPIEVVVVSARASPATVRTCMHLGVVDYLVKPFWPHRLGEALDALANRARALSAGDELDQHQVDGLRGHAATESATHLGERQEEVRRALKESGLALTATEVAAATAMARVTARRHLEYLVERGVCVVDTDPVGPGRPQKYYRLWSAAPVGGALRTSPLRSSTGPREAV